MVNYYVGSPALSVPKSQISHYLPVSGFRTILTWIPLCCLTWRASWYVLSVVLIFALWGALAMGKT